MFQDVIIYQNTSGVSIVIETFTDLSVFTQLQAIIKAPDGTVATLPALIHTTNTQMKFVSTSSTFNQVGVYKIQSLADGILGETSVFEVRKGFS